MILVDFSGVLFQNVFGAVSALKDDLVLRDDDKYETSLLFKTIKGLVINSIITFQEKFSKYGDVVICLDSHTKNWRKDVLKTYKGSRKEGREQSHIPFDELFPIVDEMIEQFKTNTPWKVVLVEGAEADDVILCLAQTYSKIEDVMIISSDKDMIQAQRSERVHQYSPLTRKYVTAETKSDNLNDWIQEHIILGDVVDEVPRITDNTEFSKSFIEYLKSLGLSYTPKQYLQLSDVERENIEFDYNVMTKKNEKDIWKNIKLGPKTIQKMILSNTLDEFLDSNELYRENYERNKILVLQEYIPTEIYNNAILSLKEQEKDTINISNFKNYLNDSGLFELSESLPRNFVNCNNSNNTISIDDFI